MVTVTISSKFQIVIPTAIREPLNLKPGERLCMIHHNNRIEIIPVKTIRDMRGFIKGMDSRIEREGDRL